jgi:hypothetical protein
MGLAASTAFADATWTQIINVADGTGPNVDLTFGVNPTATTGIDAALSEVEQPPKPPAPNFDARFTGGTIGNGLLIDIRPGVTPVAQTTLTIDVQTVVNGATFTLTWNNAQLATKVTSAQLQDGFGGVIVNVDMTAQGSFTTAVQPLKVIYTSVDPYVPPVNYTQLVVQAQPNTVTSGQVMAPALQILAQDGGGNPANTAVTIAASKATGAGTLSGTLTANTNPATGIATFSNLIYTAVANGEIFTIQASAVDLSGNPLTVATANITANIPPLTPPVLTPVGAAVVGTKENQTPLLAWGVGTGAASYQLDLGTVASGCESVANDAAVAGQSYQSPRLTDGNYCWRVRSIDASGNPSAWSPNDTFNTIPTFGEWGLIFLVASMIGCGGWYLRRRTSASS